MTIYYILFAFAVVLGVLKYIPIRLSIPSLLNHDRKKIITEKDIYLILVFTLMMVIMGFRAFSVGIDTNGYVNDFYRVRTYGIGDRAVYTEIVNTLLKWLCGKISSNPQVYLIVHAIIICILFGTFIRNNSEDVYLSTVIYIGMFFAPSMNLMRQWLAMAMGVTAYSMYQQKETTRAIIYSILAVLCHTTACVLFIIPVVEKIKNKRYIILPVVALSVILIVFRVRIFSLAARFVTRYDSYLNNARFHNEGLFNIKNLIFASIIIGISYVLLFRKETIRDESTLNVLYIYEVLMILALAFSLCGTTYAMFHRVVYYFSIFLVLMLPSISNKMIFGKILRVFIICAMFFMLYRSGVSDNNGISNYMWSFQ